MAGEEENFALPVSINTDKKQSQTSHHVNSNPDGWQNLDSLGIHIISFCNIMENIDG
jgi:hypothetical protein